jgi:hypothetical protein
MVGILARDTELKGFFVVVGKRKRTFTVQGDLRKGGTNQGISPKQKKIEANSPSGATIFGKPSGPSRRLQGVSEIDAKLLMNHSIPGVNAGYITRHKLLLEDHLRRRQQAISSAAIAALGASLAENRALQDGLGRGAARRAVFNSEIQRSAGDTNVKRVYEALDELPDEDPTHSAA